MRPVSMLINGLALGSALAVAAAPPGALAQKAETAPATALTPQEERLADLVRAWNYARLFSPALVTNDPAWEAALVDAVEPARLAADDAAFAAVVDAMLGRIGGSARAAGGAPGPAPSHGPAFRTVEGAAVADCVAIAEAKAAGRVLKEEVAAIMPAANARGMVVDCRGFAPESRPDLRFTQARHSAEWVRSLLSAAARHPVETGFARVRFHDGYPPESGTSSGGYQDGLADVRLPPLAGRPNAVAPRVTLLIDSTTPDAGALAGGAQAAGLARVVRQGPAAPESAPIPGLRHVQAHVPVSSYAYPDGRQGLRPDACVEASAGDRALTIAIAQLAPGAASPGCAASPLAPQAAPEAAPSNADAQLSAGQRILALAKLWGTMEYFNPYRPLLDRPWSGQLEAWVAPFLAATTTEAYEEALQRMAREAVDSHVGVRGISRGGLARLGFAPPLYLRPVGGGFAVAAIHDAGAAPGVAVGDQLLAVDGRPVEAIAADVAQWLSVSTPQSLAARTAAYLAAGAEGSVARLTLSRGGAPFDVSIARALPSWKAARRPEDASPAWRKLAPDIGYVDLERLTRADADKAIDDLIDARAIIFDLRGYPQGTAWMIAPRLAADDRPRVAAAFRRPSYRGPGEPLASFTSFEQQLPPTTKQRYRGRVIVLIDDRAISQSEHTALFFKAATDPVFIGSPTTGANGDVTTIELPGNLRVSFTGHDVRHPDGSRLQRRGIQPDMRVEPSLKGMRAGRDEVLEAAVALARKPAAR